MISINLTKKRFDENEVEGYIFFTKDETLTSASALASTAFVEKDFFPHLKEILKKHQFEGKKGQSFVLSGMRNNRLVQFIFVGVGKLDKNWYEELEAYRRALGTAVHLLKRLAIKNAVLAIPDNAPFNVSDTELVKQIAITIMMADYEFITFKTDKKQKEWACQLLLAINPSFDEAGYAQALEHGLAIGTAINNARHWADLPANVMTPTALAHEAQKIADAHSLKSTIFGREKALELSMGGFCAVDAGSDQDGKFVVLEYKTTKKNAPTIALCGKGIIFDTGGINLKPTNSIEGMKYDMSGAAAVIAMMEVFAKLKFEVNVIGITPCVENMPSGKATRPDDIITCMNGKTVEIKNTDAEGRLVLADALSYAEKNYNPDVIIDIATLTGAVQHALGHFYTGLMTKDEKLAQDLLALGKLTGDRIWQLPLDDDFNEAIKSDVADIHNNGHPAYYGGTIVGGTFLQNFVKKSRWAHLDIAGTAHHVPGINYLGKGATGSSIRLLVEFIFRMSQI